MPYGKGMGWKPAVPDIRDWKHNFAGARAAASVDLRETGHLPDIWDQGPLGSCTSHAAPAAFIFDLRMQGNIKDADDFMPSRLFHYYQERVLEGTVNEDSGATITDSIKAMNRFGLPSESNWPYIVSRFTNKPPQTVYDEGLLRQALKYAQVRQTASDMKACLTAGTPIVIGFSVYDSFESDATAANGVVKMPTTREALLGGHAVLVVGYLSGADLATKLKAKGLPTSNINLATSYWIFRNSWGTEWGDDGYGYFPQSYLTSTSLASDFWTVQQVESPDPAPVPPAPDPDPTPVPPQPTPEPVPADSTLDRAAVLAKLDELRKWAETAD